MSSHWTCFLSLLTIPSLSDPVRDSMSRTSECWFNLVLISSGIVGFGCLLEVPETWNSMIHWNALKKGKTAKEEDPTSWHKPVAAFGLLLVVMGIAAETVFEGLVSQKETEIRKYDEDALATAIKNAGDAKQSASDAADAAQNANDSADEVSAKADALDERIAAASSKLEKVESNVLLQGPRSRIIEKNRDALIKALGKFEGQRFSILHCGRQSTEEMLFEDRLSEVLGSKGAKWELINVPYPPGAEAWDWCATVMVAYNKLLPKPTDAGTELKAMMSRMKIFTTVNAIVPAPLDPSRVPPAAISFAQSVRAMYGEDILLKYPDLVVVVVGESVPVTESEMRPKKTIRK